MRGQSRQRERLRILQENDFHFVPFFVSCFVVGISWELSRSKHQHVGLLALIISKTEAHGTKRHTRKDEEVIHLTSQKKIYWKKPRDF